MPFYEPTKMLFLTGYMGSGKTTIGKTLSKLTGWSWMDLDDYIEEHRGKSIKDIFQNDGEKHFRDLEHGYLQKLIENKVSIVSLGGGTLENSENLKLVSESGTLIFLKYSLSHILDRVGKSLYKRPILADKTHLETFIKDHYAARLTHYQKADYTINTDVLGPEEAAVRILECINASKRSK